MVKTLHTHTYFAKPLHMMGQPNLRMFHVSASETRQKKKESVTTSFLFSQGRTLADSRSWKVDWPKKESATIVKRDH